MHTHTTFFNGKIYDVRQLITAAESLQEKVVSIEFFRSHTEAGNSYWEDSSGNSFGPAEIIAFANSHSMDWEKMIEAAPQYREHIESVRDARYDQFPILVIGGCVIDGVHRLTRAVLDCVTTIRVKEFYTLPEEAILRW